LIPASGRSVATLPGNHAVLGIVCPAEQDIFTSKVEASLQLTLIAKIALPGIIKTDGGDMGKQVSTQSHVLRKPVQREFPTGVFFIGQAHGKASASGLWDDYFEKSAFK